MEVWTEGLVTTLVSTTVLINMVARDWDQVCSGELHDKGRSIPGQAA